jgi:adenylate cyclase
VRNNISDCMKDFLQDIKEEIADIFSSNSSISISKTLTVPNVEDTGFTLASGNEHKAKTIETCVLFIDIRNSTQLNLEHSNEELAQLYSAFIVSMLRAAEYFGGYVRNINGDRVMVVFDVDNCFINAVQTAVLLNTIANNVIGRYFSAEKFECGIGIDYGQMLVVKTGTIKRGKENQFYKSFVWLGKPANLASKLTDLANKDNYFMRIVKRVLKLEKASYLNNYKQSFKSVIEHYNVDFNEFASKLTKSRIDEPIRYDNKNILYWLKISATNHPILLTQEVYAGLRQQEPESELLNSNLMEQSTVKVKGYSGSVYGLNAYYSALDDVD